MDFQTWLGKTPEGQKAAAAEASEHVTDRLAIGEKIKNLENGLAEAIGPARKAVRKELGLFEKAREASTAAEMKLRRAQVDEHNITTRAETEIGQLEQSLRDGAIPGIAVFLNELAGLWNDERKHWPWSHRDQPGSAGKRIEQIRRVTEQVTELYFETNPEEAEAALAKLKAELDAPMAAVA